MLQNGELRLEEMVPAYSIVMEKPKLLLEGHIITHL